MTRVELSVGTNGSGLAVACVPEAGGVVAKTVDGFFDGTARSSPHTWVEFPDGTWIDPTSAQLGLPVCVILPPGDDRRRFYTPVPTAATVS